jgi:hypothetical protein
VLAWTRSEHNVAQATKWNRRLALIGELSDARHPWESLVVLRPCGLRPCALAGTGKVERGKRA